MVVGTGAMVVAGFVVVAGAVVGEPGAEDAGGGDPDAVAGKLGTVTYRFDRTHENNYLVKRLLAHLGTGVEGRSWDGVVVRGLGLVAVDVDGH